MLTTPMAVVKMVYKMPSCAHYHSKSDTNQGKMPEALSFYHLLTTSHSNTKQLSGLFFLKVSMVMGTNDTENLSFSSLPFQTVVINNAGSSTGPAGFSHVHQECLNQPSFYLPYFLHHKTHFFPTKQGGGKSVRLTAVSYTHLTLPTKA